MQVKAQKKAPVKQLDKYQYRSAQRQANTKRHQKRRKRRHRFLATLLVLFALTAGIMVCLAVFFKIENITVEGNSLYSTEEIISASGLQQGENLFRFSTDKLSKKLVNDFTYIDDVQVKRQYPSGVVLQVNEAVGQLAYQAQDSYMLVSARGKVLEVSGEKPQGVPLLMGMAETPLAQGEYVQPEPEKKEVLEQIQQSLEKYGYDNMDIIDLRSTLEIRLLYQNRLLITLGTTNQLDYKLQFTKNIIDTKLSATDVGSIDASTGGTIKFRADENFLSVFENQQETLPESLEPSMPEI